MRSYHSAEARRKRYKKFVKARAKARRNTEPPMTRQQAKRYWANLQKRYAQLSTEVEEHLARPEVQTHLNPHRGQLEASLKDATHLLGMIRSAPQDADLKSYQDFSMTLHNMHRDLKNSRQFVAKERVEEQQQNMSLVDKIKQRFSR